MRYDALAVAMAQANWCRNLQDTGRIITHIEIVYPLSLKGFCTCRMALELLQPPNCRGRLQQI
jgi:hypothetical protein